GPAQAQTATNIRYAERAWPQRLSARTQAGEWRRRVRRADRRDGGPRGIPHHQRTCRDVRHRPSLWSADARTTEAITRQIRDDPDRYAAHAPTPGCAVDRQDG